MSNYIERQPQVQYVIRSLSESDIELDGDAGAFWSNVDGWGSFQAATRFSTKERMSLNLPMSAKLDAEWMLEEEARDLEANRNLSNYIDHPASGKTGTFAAKYDQHAERNGQSFTVLGAVDPSTYDADECGEMFTIRFADGVQIDAWPEEVQSAMNVSNYIESSPSRASGHKAYEATEEDVENVLRSNSLAVANTNGMSFESMANELHGKLDFDLIEQAALAGDDLDEQTDYANDEIARQLREMGVLEPLKPAYDSPSPGM